MTGEQVVQVLFDKTRERKLKWTRGGEDDRWNSNPAEWYDTTVETNRIRLEKKQDMGDRFGPETLYTLTVRDAITSNSATVQAPHSHLISLWEEIERQPKDDLVTDAFEKVKNL